MNKMSTCLFFLYFPFMFLAVPLLSNGENVHNYTLCSTNYSCGHIQNIGYPFWGDPRPNFCGISDLKLSCGRSNQDAQSTMNIFSNAGEFAVEVGVLDINASSHTMVFSLDMLLETCYSPHTTNSPFISSLKLKIGYEPIKLFYGCSNCNSSNVNHFKSFKCFNYDGTPGSAYYFGNTSDNSTITDKSCLCQNNVTFPVEKRGLDDIGRSTNETILDVLKNYTNLRMEYVANFTACSKCEHSGGICGSSSDDLTSEKFLCYCRYGSYPLMCPPQSDTGRKKLSLGLGIGVAALGLVVLVVFCLRKKLKLSQSDVVARSACSDCSASELERRSIFFSVPLFSYKELTEATGNFDQSNELGKGGFGVVYYGKLKDGREIAVKCLHEKSYKRVEQFMNEIRILTHLRHQNLVSLHGCTSHHCKELLLVYEFVKNGTVADHLYGKKAQSGQLSWSIRLRIAIETASALSYLHASEIIHRDVKTNNILLDSNFGVKVADFGLSRLFPTDVTHVSTAPQGTPGYLDPEYHLCYKLTDKSDVYSFGVVLIELISSLPAINMDRQKLEINLSNYAINKIQRCAFHELVDPQLGFASNFKVRRSTTLVAELAFQCLQHDKEFRPSMDEALETLKRIESSDYEALLRVEVTKKNVEDSEPLHAEDQAKNTEVNAEKIHYSNTAPSIIDFNAELLSSHRLYSSSPVSVTDKWVSRSTTLSISK